MFKITPIAGAGADRRLVEFSYEGNPGHFVAVAGSFNDWDPEVTRLPYDPARHLYAAAVELERGDYEYKFVVDGEWLLDESNPGFTANDFGTLNSILAVE